MSRIVHTGDTPAKRRHAHLRSCAEAVRLLATREHVDDEARDLAAFLVFNLRGAWATIAESAEAWTERDYVRKAEALRHEWRWTRQGADALDAALRAGRWERLPDLLAGLAGPLGGVSVTTLTRDADWWAGAYRALLRTPPPP